MRTIYSKVAIQIGDQSLKGLQFNDVRLTLKNLLLIASTNISTCTLTRSDIEHYLKQRRAPIIAADRGACIPRAFSPFAVAHNLVYGRRRLFLTRKKHLGLGPASLEEGDTIFILCGAASPFVLRPTACLDGGPRHFNLVGEAYAKYLVASYTLCRLVLVEKPEPPQHTPFSYT